MYKVTIFFYDSPPVVEYVELDRKSLEWFTTEWQSNNKTILRILIERY